MESPYLKTVSLPQMPPKQSYALASFVLLAALLLPPPLFSGLFLARDLLGYMVVAGAAGIMVGILLLLGEVKGRSADILDWCVAGLTVLYGLSILWAASPGDAVYGALKMGMILTVYGAVSILARGYEAVRKSAALMVVAAFVVAVVGLLAAAGIVTLPNAFSHGMIASTFQYINASASYLSAFALLVLVLALDTSRREAVLYALVSFFLMTISFSAVSKGGMLATLFGSALLAAGLSPARRRRFLVMLVPVLLVSFLAASNVLPVIERANPAVDGEQVAARDAVEREWLGIGDLQGNSYVTRMDFYRWAWAILCDHPFGTGGGGWGTVYHHYQDYLFYTSEVHNHFLQVGVETGWPGLLVFVGFWAALLVTAWRHRRDPEGHLVWGLAAVALALAFHAGYDADFSWPAILLAAVLCGRLSANLAADGEEPAIFRSSGRSPMWSVLVAMVTLVVLLAGITGTLGFQSMREAMAAEQQGKDKEAIAGMRRATVLIPYNGSFHAVLAKAAAEHPKAVANAASLSEQEASRALYWYRGTGSVYQQLYRAAGARGDRREQIRIAEEAISFNPWEVVGYSMASRAYLDYGYALKGEGRTDEAKQAFRQCLQVAVRLERQKDTVDPLRARYWHGSELTVTREMMLDQAWAYYLLGERQQAVEMMAGLKKDATAAEAEELEKWIQAIQKEKD